MSPAFFVDSDGWPGRIRDDLTLSYCGTDETAAAIESCIDDADADCETTDATLEALVIDLPHECPVREIERENAGSGSG